MSVNVEKIRKFLTYISERNERLGLKPTAIQQFLEKIVKRNSFRKGGTKSLSPEQTIINEECVRTIYQLNLDAVSLCSLLNIKDITYREITNEESFEDYKEYLYELFIKNIDEYSNAELVEFITNFYDGVNPNFSVFISDYYSSIGTNYIDYKEYPNYTSFASYIGNEQGVNTSINKASFGLDNYQIDNEQIINTNYLKYSVNNYDNLDVENDPLEYYLNTIKNTTSDFQTANLSNSQYGTLQPLNYYGQYINYIGVSAINEDNITATGPTSTRTLKDSIINARTNPFNDRLEDFYMFSHYNNDLNPSKNEVINTSLGDDDKYNGLLYKKNGHSLLQNYWSIGSVLTIHCVKKSNVSENEFIKHSKISIEYLNDDGTWNKYGTNDYDNIIENTEYDVITTDKEGNKITKKKYKFDFSFQILLQLPVLYKITVLFETNREIQFGTTKYFNVSNNANNEIDVYKIKRLDENILKMVCDNYYVPDIAESHIKDDDMASESIIRDDDMSDEINNSLRGPNNSLRISNVSSQKSSKGTKAIIEHLNEEYIQKIGLSPLYNENHRIWLQRTIEDENHILNNFIEKYYDDSMAKFKNALGPKQNMLQSVIRDTNFKFGQFIASSDYDNLEVGFNHLLMIDTALICASTTSPIPAPTEEDENELEEAEETIESAPTYDDSNVYLTPNNASTIFDVNTDVKLYNIIKLTNYNVSLDTDDSLTDEQKFKKHLNTLKNSILAELRSKFSNYFWDIIQRSVDYNLQYSLDGSPITSENHWFVVGICKDFENNSTEFIKAYIKGVDNASNYLDNDIIRNECIFLPMFHRIEQLDGFLEYTYIYNFKTYKTTDETEIPEGAKVVSKRLLKTNITNNDLCVIVPRLNITTKSTNDSFIYWNLYNSSRKINYDFNSLNNNYRLEWQDFTVNDVLEKFVPKDLLMSNTYNRLKDGLYDITVNYNINGKNFTNKKTKMFIID